LKNDFILLWLELWNDWSYCFVSLQEETFHINILITSFFHRKMHRANFNTSYFNVPSCSLSLIIMSFLASTIRTIFLLRLHQLMPKWLANINLMNWTLLIQFKTLQWLCMHFNFFSTLSNLFRLLKAKQNQSNYFPHL
jgi:hypothetical protein